MNTGGISIEGSSVYRPRLDLNGYSSTINGLVANAQSEVTNFASAVTSTLTFGAFKDGVLQADIRGNIDVVKSNATTTLTVRDTSLPGKFSIAEGTVRVEAGSTGVSSLGELTLESGATLAIDGAVVNCTSFHDNGGAVSCSNGGRLVYVPAAGTTYHLDAVNAFDIGGVHVRQGGTLVFSGDRCTNEWYRFRFRAAETGTDRLEVGRIALSSATNNIVDGRNYMYGSTFLACRLASCDEPVVDQVGSGWTNYVYQAATATAPKDLPRGKALLKPGVKFMCQKDSLSKQMFDTLFDCKTGWDSSLSAATEFMAVGLSLNEQNSGTWVDVTFRLAEGKAMARSYSLFATTWATRMARSWVVQSSPDGVEWEDMDERSFTSAKAEYFSGISYNWYAYPHGYRFTSGHLTGAKGFSPGAVVQVDAGGVLDCSMVDGGQTVSALVVDVATGCGTFKGMSFAPAGTIEVSNWDKSALYNGIPFSIDGTTGVENLANWSVLVDGSVTSRALFYSDGRLYLKRKGAMIIVL